MREPSVRGRYAPSPTGQLHLGNARTALAAWLSVRAQHGVFVLRVEDLDRARTVPGLEQEAMNDLAWLGIDWDEGPARGGAFPPYRQSERTRHYEAALRRLNNQQRVFPCRLSRRDLQDLASAPHRSVDSPYPPSLRPTSVEENWYDRLQETRDAAIRFVTLDTEITYDDLVYGTRRENVLRSVGDFVLRRRDDVYAYQLAVVVDDLAMQLDEVVRGRDLMDSTARQIQLIEALGGKPPRYAHVPLVLNVEGEKLSKRDQGLTVASLRAAGVSPDAVVGWMAHSLGLLDVRSACAPHALIDTFAWSRIRRTDTRVPPDLVSCLLELQ